MSVMITDLGIIKNHLDITVTDSGEDNRLQQFLNQVEEIVFAQTLRGADLYSNVSYTEFHSGVNRQRLYARMRPMTNVTSLHVDAVGYYGKGDGDIFSANALWTEGVNYVPIREDESERNRSEIQAINQVFPLGQGNIKLLYDAGYSALPADLEFSICQLVALVRNSSEKGQILNSETFGKYQWKGADEDSENKPVLAGVNATLSRYRNVPI